MLPLAFLWDMLQEDFLILKASHYAFYYLPLVTHGVIHTFLGVKVILAFALLILP